MKKTRLKLPRDPIQRARAILDQATGEAPKQIPPKETPKQAAGRKGGLVGGPTRAKRMTAEQRSESARNAAQARWKHAKP